MKPSRIDIGTIRREQIVDAAAAIIAEQGLQNLSLSEIEKRAGMTRGHLTYYFPAKEEILLAVFDRLLQLMCDRHHAAGLGPEFLTTASVLDMVRFILQTIMEEPPANPEFNALQYTFLSQIGHREDFRQRLASLYEEWRGCMAQQLTDDRAQHRLRRKVSPRAMASLIQAMLHGVAMQLEADPKAFDRQEMLDLCLDVLGTYLLASGPNAGKTRKTNGRRGTNGSHESSSHRRQTTAKRIP